MGLLDDEEMLPFFGNPALARQGAKARAAAQGRGDVNMLPDPRTYAIISGLLGTAPDEMGFSVLNPDYEGIQRVARPAFAVGTALGMAPLVGAAGFTRPAARAVSAGSQRGSVNVGGSDPLGLLDTTYRSSHTAPNREFGAPLHDLTGGGQMYPADVYSPKATQYYGTGYPIADKQAFDLARRVRGNPEAEVTMYRAVPKDPNIASINPGDWVTLSKDYAKTHGESALLGKYKIISQKVKAKDLWTNADSIHEFGYSPD